MEGLTERRREAASVPLPPEEHQDGAQESLREVRQGQMTEFLGTLRCATCVRGDHKCWIREDDEECFLCSWTHEPCIFTRAIIKQGIKAAFLWNDLIESERSSSSSLHKSRVFPQSSDQGPYSTLNEANEVRHAQSPTPIESQDRRSEVEERDVSCWRPDGARTGLPWPLDSIPDVRPLATSTIRRPFLEWQLPMGGLNDEQDQHAYYLPIQDAEKRHVTEDPSSPGTRQKRQDPSAGLPRHKRRMLDPSRRAKTSMVRSFGACLRCRLMKEGCSLARPCIKCQRVCRDNTKVPRFGLLPCIQGRLKSLLPNLFGGNTTGLLSTSQGDSAFQQELSPHGQLFLRNMRSHPADVIWNLTLLCFDSQGLNINLGKVHELLDKLDELYIRHRLNSSLENLTSAVLSICNLMVVWRAFVETYGRQLVIKSSQRDINIQSGLSTIGSLFIVATTAMSDDQCFNIISQNTALESETDKDATTEVHVPKSHPPTTQTLYERVESLLFRHPIDSSKFSNMTDQRTTYMGEGSEIPIGHIEHAQRPIPTRTWSTEPKWSEPQSCDPTNEDTNSSTAGTEFRDMTREVFPALEGDPSQEYIWVDHKTPTEFLEGLKCTHCNHQSKTQSDAKKHMRRHERPFECSIPGCTRDQGFGSQMDLERHQRSVHGKPLPGAITYRCAAEHCLKNEKVWPRADNFRQHCQRLHPDLDTTELMRRSVLSEP